MKKYILLLSIISAFFFIAGCAEQGPAEKAGEAIDESVEKGLDAVDDAANDVEDSVEEAGEAIDDQADGISSGY